ncbi:MAG TPA: hypothetical protein VL356_10350, partial [Acidocella sp.]|jgi:hypothetical protein|nr:hypothetical protein [Acidocella sp.]
MKALFLPRHIIISGIGLFVLLASGCAAPGGGSFQRTSIGVGYYQPSGFYYGGWGPGYRVGPPWPGQFRRSRTFVGGRPTRLVRPIPSIPSRRLRGRPSWRFR